MLQNFMLVSLVFNCSHKVLETTYVYFVVKNALKVFEIDLLRQDGIELRLISFSVKRLRYCSLVCFVRQLGINLNKLCIDFLLEARVITL